MSLYFFLWQTFPPALITEVPNNNFQKVWIVGTCIKIKTLNEFGRYYRGKYGRFSASGIPWHIRIIFQSLEQLDDNLNLARIDIEKPSTTKILRSQNSCASRYPVFFLRPKTAYSKDFLYPSQLVWKVNVKCRVNFKDSSMEKYCR